MTTKRPLGVSVIAVGLLLVIPILIFIEFKLLSWSVGMLEQRGDALLTTLIIDACPLLLTVVCLTASVNLWRSKKNGPGGRGLHDVRYRTILSRPS
jgi:hypothetical protein